jgi:hypothetical protein
VFCVWVNFWYQMMWDSLDASLKNSLQLVLNQRYFMNSMNVILYTIVRMVPMQSFILCSGFLCILGKEEQNCECTFLDFMV